MNSFPKKIWIPLILIVVLIIAGAIYFFYPFLKKPVEDKFPKDLGLPEGKEAKIPPFKISPEEEKEALPIPATISLNESDEVVRKYGRELTPHKQIWEWLKIKNLIRTITATIVNISEGKSPRTLLKPLAPTKGFKIEKKGNQLSIHPDSYRRYDLIANVISSLDAKKTVRLYNALRPLFQEAYRELGYSSGDFDEVLIQAIVMTLKMPQINGKILLEEEEEGINYLFVDDNLEDLNDFHKHLVRMGRDNALKVQKKVREIAQELKIPEDKLPQPKIYVAKVK